MINLSKRLLTLATTLTLSLGFVACDDDVGDSLINNNNNEETCVGETHECDGTVHKFCDGGKIKTVDCKTDNKICDGESLSCKYECEDSEKASCFNVSTKIICKDHHYKTETCPSDAKYCVTGECVSKSLEAICAEKGQKVNIDGTSCEVVDNWIGNDCTCTGAGCSIFDVPLPVPDLSIGPATITGCENVESDIDGAVSVCLRTIPKEMATTAPPVYFPAGYCTLSAVGCTGDVGLCEIASYGDVDKMTKCPMGTTLLEAVFDYNLMGKQTVITNKVCAKNCETNVDCNETGEVECIKKDNVKFCYNRKNFEFMNRGYSVTPFN